MREATTMREAGFSRRHLLRALGSTLTVPLFMKRALAAPRGPRLVLVMQQNGTHPSAFWPDPTTMSSPILAPLSSVPNLKSRMVVVKGLFHPEDGAGNAHDQGFNSLWTGHRTVGTGDRAGFGQGGGPSLDQVLKRQGKLPAPFPVINIGVLAALRGPFRPNRLSFVYSGARQPVPAEIDFYKLTATYFGAGAPTTIDPAKLALQLKQQRSLLDFVRADLTALAGRVGPTEKMKIDLHATALREYETRLAALETPAATPNSGGACGTGVTIPPNMSFTDEANVPALMKLAGDFSALALGCNITNVITLQWGYGGNHWRFRWLGIDQNTHDDIAHRDNGPGSAAAPRMIKMNVWYAEQIAYLAKALDRYPSEGGTALDDGLVVWGNELATGPHGLKDIPLVFLGRAGGRLKQTGVFVNNGAQTYQRAGCTVMNLMGAQTNGFGDAGSCGMIQGMSVG
jgi:hypothetical protein